MWLNIVAIAWISSSDEVTELDTALGQVQCGWEYDSNCQQHHIFESSVGTLWATSAFVQCNMRLS